MEKPKERRFEMWMIVNLAIGLGQVAFLPLLIVPYITELTGDAADSGVVVAIAGLAALLAPVMGRLADRFLAHRTVVTLGLAGLALTYVGYAIGGAARFYYVLLALLMGVSLATVQSVGPAFILDTNLPREVKVRRMPLFYALVPMGQLLGGAILAIVAAWSYAQKFWLAAGVVTLGMLVFWLVSAKPARRILGKGREPLPSEESAEQARGRLRQVLFSSFGLLLLMLVIGGIGFNAIIAQIANIMLYTFGIQPGTTSALIALVGLINLVGYFVAGAWIGRAGGLTTFTAAYIMHLTGLVGMSLLSLALTPPLVLVAAFMLIFYLGEPYGRIPQPILGIRYSPMPTATANAWIIGAISSSAFLSGLLAGLVADAIGFSAILWMSVAAFVIALAIQLFLIWPVERRIRAEEAAAGTRSVG